MRLSLCYPVLTKGLLQKGRRITGMKKSRVLLAAALASMAFPTGVMASEAEQQLSITLTAEPEYSVTIPASVAMGNEGTYVDVTASDVKNLPEGKKISVTISGTDKYNDQMLVEAKTTPRTSLRYQIISEDGELIETNASTGAVGVGKEVVSFTGNETKQYQIKPVIAGRYEYDVEYTGCIMFGIEVTDAE